MHNIYYPVRISGRLTHSGDDLSLHAELILEAASKIADASSPILGNVGHLADVIEHVPAGEEQDGDQADGGPDVAVLDDGEKERPSDEASSGDAGDKSQSADPPQPVDRALDRRVRSVGHMAREPVMELLGSLVAIVHTHHQHGRHFRDLVGVPYPPVKSNRMGSAEATACGPVVGGNRRRTGAVWRPSCKDPPSVTHSPAATLVSSGTGHLPP